jgi:hypothetical protein
MTRDDEQKLGVLARLVLAALILLIIGGIACNCSPPFGISQGA